MGLSMHRFLLEEMWVRRENGEGGIVWLQCKPEPHGGARKEGQLGRSAPGHQQAVSGRFGMAVTESASEESHMSQTPACRSIPLTFSLLLLEQQNMGVRFRAWQLGQDSEIGKVHPHFSHAVASRCSPALKLMFPDNVQEVTSLSDGEITTYLPELHH